MSKEEVLKLIKYIEENTDDNWSICDISIVWNIERKLKEAINNGN